jgi:hypothetical protein
VVNYFGCLNLIYVILIIAYVRLIVCFLYGKFSKILKAYVMHIYKICITYATLHSILNKLEEEKFQFNKLACM